MTRACYRCGREVGAVERVGRRDACLGCGSDLHCCRNCEFFDAAYHNQCREPQAERQVEKEAGNFCEYFSFTLAQAPAEATGHARAQLQKLFSGGRRAVAAGDGVDGQANPNESVSPTPAASGADSAAPSRRRS